MVDHVTPKKRSEMMSRVKRTGSTAELTVRQLIWGMGLRYRLNVKSLPGSPDLVFSKKRKVIFVHGCFWHGHADCNKGRLPKSNYEYWAEKISKNKERDLKVESQLKDNGWDVLTIWQCELRDTPSLKNRIDFFFKKFDQSGTK